MDKNVKYKDYRIGEHVFTVQFTRRYDLGVGAVDVVVWEFHTPRSRLLQRLIDFFKYNSYWHGTWFVGDEMTLDEYAIHLCDTIVSSWHDEEEAEKFWNELS